MERRTTTLWHTLDTQTALDQLKVNPAQGLSAAEASRRLAEHGPNELIEKGGRSIGRMICDQLTSTMVVVLLVAALISMALKDFKDAIAILAIVILNAAFGFFQEYRAEKAMAALKRMSTPQVRVRRDGQVKEVSSRELVPGDIVLLEAGNLVPADARLIESARLQIQEAALTGESESVTKKVDPFTDHTLPVADRKNMAYLGTTIAGGRGAALVTSTGMDTELGAIAKMIQSVETEPTPLQRRLDQLGRSLALAALALVGIIFALGILRGEDIKLMFLTAVSMVVAVVPEGLPAVVTIALALGAQRMLKRKALIRKLPAAETLGSVTAICSDKTGTLTQNRMTVTALEVDGSHRDLMARNATPAPADDAAFSLLLAAGALCNDAHLQESSQDSEGPRAVGESTEAALLLGAVAAGLRKPDLERHLPRVAELAFDSDRKRMTTVQRLPGAGVEASEIHQRVLQVLNTAGSGEFVVFTKGAVDSLLGVCNRVWSKQGIKPLDESAQARLNHAADDMAHEGKRVLGVAIKVLSTLPAEHTVKELECELIFLGLVGLHDPARAEAKHAVETCKAAGIRALMITGDHPLTAQHIAREVGFANPDRVITGKELLEMPPEELDKRVEQVSLYARVLPEHKFHIVEALQRRGHIVAMTGDGVNDAPALKRSDIGVAMGITGTDVSKEASDMVLLDDNFTTIVSAVEEGRTIFDNIRKFVRYVLAGNLGEILVMLIAPFFGMPMALVPLQILWINLISDGICGLAMSVEPPERDTMRRAPYPSTQSVFGQGMVWHILWVGSIMGVVPFVLGWSAWSQGNDSWQTMVFGALAFGQIFHTLAVRSWRDSLFQQGVHSNPAMFWGVGATVLLTLGVIYLPFLQKVFSTTALSPSELCITLTASTAVFWSIELEKWFKRRHSPETNADSVPHVSGRKEAASHR